ncbi:MAG: hypothetical protein GWO20_16590 [Candidatus Korarchaeota archaeon]|nr:hypothetical protein [Candidatus Korarchaeota archaeon]NIU85023.1 hypothetical protein [Candidatus Thorarchaeota archaeon]NIW15048.1 hypothetical protein [Candidatus Thorarchaeota archaeon]NIW53058.1 hypothetical protein [Candidatus Korarchaeota archaeon]
MTLASCLPPYSFLEVGEKRNETVAQYVLDPETNEERFTYFSTQLLSQFVTWIRDRREKASKALRNVS